MNFARCSTWVTVLLVCCFSAKVGQAIPVLVTYSHTSGELTATAFGGWAGFTTFEAVSERELFLPDAIEADIIRSPFDVITPGKLFVLRTDGLVRAEFGPVLPAALSLDDLQLRINGSSVITNLRDYQLVVETSRVGDFDGDNTLSGRDIEMLQEIMLEGNESLSADFEFAQLDLNDDQTVNSDDVLYWTRVRARTWVGDVKLDGLFDTTDLVQVFQRGRYDAPKSAGWTSGDWNSDGRFDSADFVLAHQDGGYGIGRREPVVVPEPSAASTLLTLLLPTVLRRRGRQSSRR